MNYRQFGKTNINVSEVGLGTWQKKQKVVVTKRGKELVIKDWQ